MERERKRKNEENRPMRKEELRGKWERKKKDGDDDDDDSL